MDRRAALMELKDESLSDGSDCDGVTLCGLRTVGVVEFPWRPSWTDPTMACWAAILVLRALLMTKD